MKKLVVAFLFVFLLAGCEFSFSIGNSSLDDSNFLDFEEEVSEAMEEENADTDELSEDEVENVEEDVEQEVSEVKGPNYEVYRQWVIDDPYQDDEGDVFYSFSTFNRKDCVGMWNGETYGGDLLSSLVLQENLQDRIELNVYTPAYVSALEKKIADFGRTNYGKNFYASYVCNYGEYGDLVAGFYWPAGVDTCTENGWECFYDSRAQEALVYVNGDEVYSYEDIRLLNQTHTGGEVDHCGAYEQNGGLMWECFVGWDPDKGEEYVRTWDIRRNGEVFGPKESTRSL